MTLRIVRWLRHAERLTRPVQEETQVAFARRWAQLPGHVRTDAQPLGRVAVGCEGTHGVFPRCNFTCTPCYHSAEANRVRVDGAHTLAEVDAQMALLAGVRGPHAHAQLIGGEVSLLDPDDHAATLAVMRGWGREPMSFTHGDIDYDYLQRLALGPDGARRFARLGFAGHFDTTMRGRRGLRRPESEADLNPYRQAFCGLFARLRADHGVRSFLAHNMTVTPGNVEEIPALIRDCRGMGLDADEVWTRIEEGAGSRLPYGAVQTGDVRCNRTAFGCYLGERWLPLLDDEDPADLSARDAFYRSRPPLPRSCTSPTSTSAARWASWSTSPG